MGDTKESVLKEMGKPTGIVSGGGFEILRYANGEVEIQNGSVIDTTLPPPPPPASSNIAPERTSPRGVPAQHAEQPEAPPHREVVAPASDDLPLPSHAPVANTNSAKTTLFDSARLGDSAAVAALLAKGADVDSKDTYGNTVLMYAASNGHLNIVKILLAKGADVRAKNEDGAPALMDAAKAGNLEIVNTLLAKGAKLNSRDDFGWTALMEAVRDGRTETVKALMAKGARVNTRALNDWTSLLDAAEKGRTPIVEILLAGGAHVETKDDSGETALVVAVREDHTETVKALLAARANANARSSHGEPVLTMAAAYGPIEIVAALLANGADVHAIDDDCGTALENATRKDRSEIVSLLKQAGAEDVQGKKLKRPQYVRQLLSRLRSSDMETRLTVAEVLGDIADPAAIKPLLSLMVYLDDDLRMTAAEGIGKIGDLRTAGVLIAYLNANPRDEDAYEPLVSLGEMGGNRARRAIEHRVEKSSPDSLTRYHGTKALAKISEAGTSKAEVSARKTALWHFCCWIGFLGRWLVIVIARLRNMMDPSRSTEDQIGRTPLWFERFLLFLFSGLCVIRLLYVLVFHMNPGVLKLALYAGMPLGRYVLCAVMDPLVLLLTVRGILRRKRWGWPLLFAYIPAAILLGRYDYGYWTIVMIVSAGWGALSFGAWVLARRLPGRPSNTSVEPGCKVTTRSCLTKSLLTALVSLNAMRLLSGVAISVAFLKFFMAWGWDALSVVLGFIAAAIGGVVDAAIMYLVNRWVLKLVGRNREPSAWLQNLIDTLTALILGGLCLLACGFIVYNAIDEEGSIAQALGQTGIPLLLIAGLSAYPTIQVWKNGEQRILRYFVIATIMAYLAAQPLALVWR